MKKRLTALLLALCLLLTLLPVGVWAADGDGTTGTPPADTGDPDPDAPGEPWVDITSFVDLCNKVESATAKTSPVYLRLEQTIEDSGTSGSDGDHAGFPNLTVPRDVAVFIDLNGHDLILDPHDYSVSCNIYVSGTLTIEDRSAADPPAVNQVTHKVIYSSGKIECRRPSSGSGISVDSGGTLCLKSGTVALTQGGDAAIAVSGENAKAVIAGGYVSGTRDYNSTAVLITGKGAFLEVTEGVLEGNHAIANGEWMNSENAGETKIAVSGGALIGSSCGIEQYQPGSLDISGGSIYSYDGIGIQIHRGTLKMSGGDIAVRKPGVSYDPSNAPPYILIYRGMDPGDSVEAVNKEISISMQKGLHTKYPPVLPNGSSFCWKADESNDPVTYTAAPNTEITLDYNYTKPDGSHLTKVISTDTNGILPYVSDPSPDSTPGGQCFVYWSEDKAGKTPVDLSKVFTSPTTLYAIWEPVTVTFDYQEPDIPRTETKEVNADFQIETWPDDPTRLGYNFDAWYFSPTLNYPSSQNRKVSTSEEFSTHTTVYAGWTKAKVTLRLDGEDGAQHGVLTAGNDGTVTLPDLSDYRQESAFLGWFDSPSGGTPVSATYPASYQVHGDTTLYGLFQERPKVVFTFNIPNKVDETMVVGKDGKLPDLPADPSRTGYLFLGWAGKSDTAGTIVAKDTLKAQVFASDAAFSAQWLKLPVVSFDLGYKGSSAPKPLYADRDGRLTSAQWPKNPSRPAYAFDGWYTGKEDGDARDATYIYRTDTTLYAHWSPITITFDLNYPGAPTPETKNVGTDYKLSSSSWPKPTRPGCTLAGWYTEKEDGEKKGSGNTFKSSTTLYAHWTENPPVVTFDANCDKADGVPAAQSTGAEGLLKWPAKKPTRTDGYLFEDWFFDREGGDPIRSDYSFRADTVVYAHWLKAPTVTFDPNFEGGEPMVKTVGAEWKISQADWPAEPVQTGFLFTGWYTEAEGGSFRNRGMEFRVDATLYAHWEKKAEGSGRVCTITLDLQGGTLEEAGPLTTDAAGHLPALPGIPTRSGYDFAGWYTGKDSGEKVAADTVFTADTTIYARWTAQGTTPSEPVNPDTPSDGYYDIDRPDRVTGGTFSLSRSRARAGQTITIELEPRSNFELDQIFVTDGNGQEIRCRERYVDEYTFTMPDSDVFVDVVYQRRYSDGGGSVYFPVEEPVQTGPVGWYYQYGRLYDTDGSALPSGAVLTRDILLAVLYNLDGRSTDGPQVWATKNGILPNYYESGLFGVDKALSREQAAMILYAYARYRGYGTAQRSSLTGYSDYSEIRTSARTAMSWARAAGIMNGTTATTLSPTGTLTCGQAEVLLSRFLSAVAR